VLNTRPFPIRILAHLSLTTGWLLLATASRGQDAQVERARQFENRPLETGGTLNATGMTVEATQGADTESFGIQQLLREQPKIQPFSAFMEVSTFFTNNVALTNSGKHSDTFLVPAFGFEYHRPLPSGFQLDAVASLSSFLYHRFTQLDFNSVNAGIGITYHAEKLPGVDIGFHYNYNNLFNESFDGSIFNSHYLNLSVQKAIPFSQAHYAFVGGSGQIAFSAPKIDERSEFAAFAGYHVNITRKWNFDVLYRYTFYDYTHGGRRDHNQAITLGTRYDFTDWCSLSATTNFIFNSSNQEVFNYDEISPGIGLSLKLAF